MREYGAVPLFVLASSVSGYPLEHFRSTHLN